MKRKLTSLLSFGIAVAALASGIGAASAADLTILPFIRHYDYKTFNGSTCQPYAGSQSGDFNQSESGIQNVSALFRWVSCPVMRDDTETTHGASLSIYLKNANGGQCDFRSQGTHGSPVANKEGNILGNGSKTLNLSVSKSEKMGNYFMRCYLPPQGYVNSYKLRERYTDLNKRTDKDASFPIFPIPIPPIISPVTP